MPLPGPPLAGAASDYQLIDPADVVGRLGTMVTNLLPSSERQQRELASRPFPSGNPESETDPTAPTSQPDRGIAPRSGIVHTQADDLAIQERRPMALIEANRP